MKGYSDFVQLASKLADSAVSSALGQSSGTNDVHGGAITPPLIRLLDIMGELAQIGTRASLVHSGSGILGKAGKPPTGGQLHPKSELSGVAADTELDGKVRDPDSVQFFQDVFLKTENVGLRLELLDRLLRLFASHPDNYVLVQELRTMPLFIQNMGKYPPLLQERVLKVLEYAVMVANCVPEQELLSLCYLMQQPLASSIRIAVLLFFEKLLSFDRHYKKMLREVGVLNLLVDDLKKCQPPPRALRRNSKNKANPDRANSVGILELERESSLSLDPSIFEDQKTLELAWGCLLSLLRKSEGNQTVFRKVNGVTQVLPLLASPSHCANVLRLLSCLISEDLSQVCL